MASFKRFPNRTAWVLLLAALFLLIPHPVPAQQAATAPSPAPSTKNNPEFLAMADEVLQEMSAITGWELKAPWKKSAPMSSARWTTKRTPRNAMPPNAARRPLD